MWTEQKYDDSYKELLASRAEDIDLGPSFKFVCGLTLFVQVWTLA